MRVFGNDIRRHARDSVYLASGYVLMVAFSPERGCPVTGEGESAEREHSGCNKVGASGCGRLSSAEVGGVSVECSIGMGIHV